MIFFINIETEELKSLPSEEMEELLSEIGRSSRLGNHIFVLERSLADFASAQACLGDLHRAEFRKLRKSAAKNFSLLYDAHRYVEVIIGDQLENAQHNRKWIVGHQLLLKKNYLSTPQLIIEDAHSDGEIYRKVLEKGTTLGRKSKMRFEPCHGGGNQTFRRLKERAIAGFVSVCIVDHDMLAPDGQRSATFLSVKKVAEGTTFVGHFSPPPYRELENIIPLRILRDCYPDVSAQKLDVLEARMTSQGNIPNGDCLWLFFDVKEGMEGDKLAKKCASLASQNWLTKKYVQGEITCVKEISFPGFGDKVVETFLHSGAALAEFHKFLRSTYWSKHFQPFFEEVSWFFLGTNERRL